jgi:hypothetical protein
LATEMSKQHSGQPSGDDDPFHGVHFTPTQ